MNNKTNKEIENEGYLAAINTKCPIDHNPYETYRIEHWIWLNGYENGLKYIQKELVLQK